MIYLFIHQNFQSHYQHIVRHLVEQGGNQIYFVSAGKKPDIAGITAISYQSPEPAAWGCHPLTIDLDVAIRKGASVADVCRNLRSDGVRPDLIVGHGGWGETLFVKDVFPETPVLTYFEFYYHATGVDLDFDSEFESQFQSMDNLRTRNGINLMAFDGTDWGNSPTQWQRSLLPPELRSRVTVLHEGVDTDLLRPDSEAKFIIPEKRLALTVQHEVITFIARNLEPYRGFHIFMRAIPEIQRRRPKAQIVIVGDDAVHYGRPPPPGTNYRELMLAEIGDRIRLEKVHFLGQINYERYRKLLQVSSVHVYLTYPFILSWSFIEAMASGCAIVGSATPPVEEVLEDRFNGLSVDFFSPVQIAERIDEVLSHSDRMQSIRDSARRTAVERFDLKRIILPQWQNLFNDLIDGRNPLLNP